MSETREKKNRQYIYIVETCNERCINRVHLTFYLYTNCQNRPCGKQFNTTAFVNLLICNVNVHIAHQLSSGKFFL
jgi:hypothetical protein